MTAPPDGSSSIFVPPVVPDASVPDGAGVPGNLQDTLLVPPSFDVPASTLFPDAPLSPVQPSGTATPLPRPEPATPPDRVDAAPEEPAEEEPPPEDSTGLDNPLFDWAR